MKTDLTGVRAAALLIGLAVPSGAIAQATLPTSAIAQFQNVQATPLLVRDVQFMLARLGIDPGPIDGIPRQSTNRAVRLFEAMHRLPLIDIQPGGIVPPDFLAQLRIATARSVLGNPARTDAGAAAATAPPAPPTGDGNSPPPSPTAGLPPAPPKPAPADRFASCAYDPEDFHIGATRFTPDTFLKEGFDGSTTDAVASLKDRLEEGRQLADRIGISALKDVQRQARVLQYFECRLSIEQASASKS